MSEEGLLLPADVAERRRLQDLEAVRREARRRENRRRRSGLGEAVRVGCGQCGRGDTTLYNVTVLTADGEAVEKRCGAHR